MASPPQVPVEAMISIKASPLPLIPAEDPLTKDQWRTLMAFADAVVPTVIEKSNGKPAFKELGVSKEQYSKAVKALETHALRSQTQTQNKNLAAEYLEERPSQLPGFRENVYRFVSTCMPKDMLKLLAFGLDLLNYRVTSLFMTGYPSAFADQPVQVRQAIIQSWSSSYVPLYRQLFKQLTMLVKQNWLKTTPTLQHLLGFPRVPVHGKPSRGFPFEFIQIPPGDSTELLETDIVIVGSGCGSGPVAKNLAEAGHRVIVVDKGYHWPSEHLPMSEEQGWSQLFMSGGALTSDDSSIAVVAGQTWGGGGTVNWSASLQTQGYVRREWATKDKLPFFTSSEFQDCLDTVCGRMGVSSSSILHNKSNDVLLEGARRLGWATKPVPQNTGGSQHYCGYCTFGCGSCEKQGPMTSWLPDAAKAGATFLEGFDVQRVLFRSDEGKKIATGVEGFWTSRDENGGVAGAPLTKRKVVIRAKRVIISAGTMQSPLILMRSGLKNKWIGKNLRLHPVTFVGSTYDEEIRPWEGGILTAVVNEFENLDRAGHGSKIESVVMMPSSWLSFAPWTSGLDYKLFAPRMKNMVGHIALQRDTGSGYIYPDPHDGRCRFVYKPTKTDRAHLLEVSINAARLNYIMGAREIFTTLPGTSVYVRPEHQKPDCATDGINCPTFNKWLDEVRKRGLPDPDTVFMSAHQMGTNKMSASPKNGVVDPKGRVWEVDEGLYVADASIFPSASGVNPMITNMAISEWISRNIVKDLKASRPARPNL